MSGGSADSGVGLTIPESKFKKFLNWLSEPFKKRKEDSKKYYDEQNERIKRNNLEWEFMRNISQQEKRLIILELK